MSEEPGVSHEEPVRSLLAVLADPTDGRRRLPQLVGLLDADEESTRIGAAWATCRVAAHLPDTAAYLTRRLVDRIEDDGPTLEAELVFEYVAAQYPNAVADELDAMETEADDRPSFRPVQGTLARANYHRPDIGKRGVGRTRLAGEGGSTGPRQVYNDDEDRRDRQDRSSDDGDERADTPGDENDGGTAREDSSSGHGDGARPSPEASWKPPDEFTAIVRQSRLDQLTVLAPPHSGRYGDVYRTLGVLDGGQLPVGLVLYHRPADRTAEFVAAMDEQLDRWAEVSDHQNVVQVYDWGAEPRPWAATEYTGQRLAARDRLAPAEALWNARKLADSVAHIHENGVVHGGIDPGNVVYYGNVIDEDERQAPLLANVGLLRVVRSHFDPTSRLDPRYAAPEYFDRRFGRIDHATDVYHLGAVLYLLFTGRPPYDGDYGRVRQRVLEDPAPRPGDVADVPPGVDEVVTKAMAPRKLRRYETVRHMEQELRGIGGEFGVDDR